jgi:hypothetical protein
MNESEKQEKLMKYMEAEQKRFTHSDVNKSSTKKKSSSVISTFSSENHKIDKLEKKLNDIHSTLKAIRWTIAAGVIFIMLVFHGHIK